MKDYEEKYNEALERAKKLYEQGTITESLGYVFPELNESYNEKIRKELIEHIKANKEADYVLFKKFSPDDVIAWLEKQGEQPTDKVEQKFKVGNWYQCTKDFFGKGVTFDKNTAYYCAIEGCLLDGCHIAIVKDLYDNFKLWSIQDAKDGDVLATDKSVFIYAKVLYNKPYAYCGVDKFGVFKDNCLENDWSNSVDNIHPATKEQRDLLFQTMKEAGWEWNREKKELKKIEPKTLNADKVIEWINNQACQGWIEDVEVDKFIEKFKKDFCL